MNVGRPLSFCKIKFYILYYMYTISCICCPLRLAHCWRRFRRLVVLFQIDQRLCLISELLEQLLPSVLAMYVICLRKHNVFRNSQRKSGDNGDNTLPNLEMSLLWNGGRAAISRLGDVLWLPRSPDLPNKWLLGGVLKTCFYWDKPRILQELIDAIVQGVHGLNTDADILERVATSLLKRLQPIVMDPWENTYQMLFSIHKFLNAICWGFLLWNWKFYFEKAQGSTFI